MCARQQPTTELVSGRVNSQFSLRSTIVLTTAVAVWFWILREISLTELSILSACGAIAGCVGHLASTYILPWRIVGVSTIFLFYSAAIVISTVGFPGGQLRVSESLEMLGLVLAAPVEMMMYVGWESEAALLVVAVLATLFFSPAHAVRPGLLSAFTSAIGLGIWFSVGLLILSHAA